MKTFWMIVAAFCGATAVFFAVRAEYDKAFMAAAVGAVTWFLSYRVQLREKLRIIDSIDDDEES